MVGHLDAVVATLQAPERVEPDPSAHHERLYHRGVGPSRWLLVVVSFEQTPGRVITAIGNRKDPSDGHRGPRVAARHAAELERDWELAQALEPLVAIDPLPRIHRMLRVTAVTPLTRPHLRVEFNDGVVRGIDCSFLMHGTLGQPLKDPAYLRQVRVDHELRTIVWPNGLDPSPELLHRDPVAVTAPQRSAA